MPKFCPISKLGKHDIGAVYDDDGTWKGGALRCLSNKEQYRDTITVNIRYFHNACDLGVAGVLFEIHTPTVHRLKYLPIHKAKILMEHAHQPEWADFKIIPWHDIDGTGGEVEFNF